PPSRARSRSSRRLADAGFSAAWLALREPADHRARAAELLPELGAWWRARRGTHVVDLGAGAGSNLRYLAPRLPGAQWWTLVDRDPALLARAAPPVGEAEGGGRVVDLVRVVADLAREGLDAVQGADLVTASAL